MTTTPVRRGTRTAVRLHRAAATSWHLPRPAGGPLRRPVLRRARSAVRPRHRLPAVRGGGPVSLFDRLTWAFIGHLVKTDPDLALQIMGAPDPERLARLQQMLTGHRPALRSVRRS
jgi:hypothetical protein